MLGLFVDDIAVSEKDPQRDRQVKGGPLLAKIGRRQVDHGFVSWELVARVLHRAADALEALLDRGVGQPDHDRPREPVPGNVHFHLDLNGLDAGKRRAVKPGHHGGNCNLPGVSMRPPPPGTCVLGCGGCTVRLSGCCQRVGGSVARAGSDR